MRSYSRFSILAACILFAATPQRADAVITMNLIGSWDVSAGAPLVKATGSGSANLSGLFNLHTPAGSVASPLVDPAQARVIMGLG